LRIGVHTGTAVLRDGDWYGSAVNVASRLCSAAGGGEVLVSDTTRGAAGELEGIELGDRPLHWLKHVPEPVIAWPAAASPALELGWRKFRSPGRTRQRSPLVCPPATEVTA
jgi:class 3 adenylate cyclase